MQTAAHALNAMNRMLPIGNTLRTIPNNEDNTVTIGFINIQLVERTPQEVFTPVMTIPRRTQDFTAICNRFRQAILAIFEHIQPDTVQFASQGQDHWSINYNA